MTFLENILKNDKFAILNRVELVEVNDNFSGLIMIYAAFIFVAE